MASTFPTTKDTFTSVGTSTQMNEAGKTLKDIVDELQDAHETVQNKVGIDSSADVSSLDYLLKNTSSVSPGHKHNLSDINGITANAAEINLLDGVTATTSELNEIDGLVAGTAQASKLVKLDANKDLDMNGGGLTGLDRLLLQNNASLQSRNNADNADVNLIKLNASDDIEIGESGSNIVMADTPVSRYFYNGFTGASTLDDGTVIATFNVNEDGDYYIKFCISISNNADSATAVRFAEVRLYDNTTSGTQIAGGVAAIPNAATGTDYGQVVGATGKVSLTTTDDVVLEFKTSAANGVCELFNGANHSWIEFTRADYISVPTFTVT